jgi:preprotein translocase subunit SecD
MPSVGGQGAGTTNYLETKLGLDLQGGLRIEYQVLPSEG